MDKHKVHDALCDLGWLVLLRSQKAHVLHMYMLSNIEQENTVWTTVCSLCSDNQKYSFEAVKTWTSEDTLRTAGQASSSVLDCDKLFFPVHLQSGHWTLAVVDLQQHTATYYDSLWVCLIIVHAQNVCMSSLVCQVSSLDC